MLDSYKVREGEIIDRKISTRRGCLWLKRWRDGGTRDLPEQQDKQALTDEQILDLTPWANRTISANQDIEWCLVDDAFYIVQSRPSLLYPIRKRMTRRITSMYLSVPANDDRSHETIRNVFFPVTLLRPCVKLVEVVC